MTDIIMCQKIYGQREQRGEKKLESTFSRSSSCFKLLSLVLSTRLSATLKAVEMEQASNACTDRALS